MTRLDSAVRQAYREDPRAAHTLLADYAELPEQTVAMYRDPGVSWAHFVARIRDLTTNNPFPLPDHNGGWEPPLG